MNRTEVPPCVSRSACLVVAALFLMGLLFLGVRLKEVQLDEAADYSYASMRQSVRRVQVSGSRGRILDRKGRVLATNRHALSIVCYPRFFERKSWRETEREIQRAIAAVQAVLKLPSAVTEQRIHRHVQQSLAIPLVVWRDIGERDLAVFSERAAEFQGFSVLESEERVYPNGERAAHLIGYVGRDRDTSEPVGDEKYHFFSPEMRGRSGVELYYNVFLRGVPGERKVRVDARGFATADWTVQEPSPGLDLHLNIDLDIQGEVERQLSQVCGACAVLDPRSGEVLALASAPTFNPNKFVPVLSHACYQHYATNPQKPLLNRAVGGTYAPGSTFKPITALAGLALGYPSHVLYACDGVFSLGELDLHCARRWGHGNLDLPHALMVSCNPFFCNLALEVGTNDLIRAARAFGLGQKTGLDFGIDLAGVVPDAQWKMRTYGEMWYAGDLVQMAIGQGMLLTTPLQMARVAGAIGTGYLVTPHLKRHLPVERTPLPFSEKQLAVVREGMRLVVAGEKEMRGSGWRGGEGVPVSVAGKTGTAEIGKSGQRRKNTWFMAYAPFEKPRVALALVIENGESGGGTAAPRVAAILRRIFSGKTGGRR